MSHTPEQSAIKVTPHVEAKLKTLVSSDEIRAYLAEVAVEQQLVTRDRFSPDILIPTEPGTAPRAFARVLNINGFKHTVEAPSEIELERKINALLRETFESRNTPSGAAPARDASTGRFASAEDRGKADEARQAEIVRQSELELKFKRGELSTADYLARSGAIERHLESQGISVEELRASTAEKQNQRFTQSWATATEEFLKSPAGADWPGGEANKVKLGEILQANPELADQPSVETLSAVYEYMKENDLLVTNEEVEKLRAISSATSAEEIRTAWRGGSSMFGR